MKEDGPESLPIPIIQRCKRVDWIRCKNRNLRSLDGCPDGLKGIFIGSAPHLSDLSPLASCSMMEELLIIQDSSITDIRKNEKTQEGGCLGSTEPPGLLTQTAIDRRSEAGVCETTSI